MTRQRRWRPSVPCFAPFRAPRLQRDTAHNEILTMNRLMTTLAFTGLLSTCPLYATAGDTDPKTALPVDNSAQPAESNEEKANKKGEEASGANAGAETESLKKEAATSTGEKTEGK